MGEPGSKRWVEGFALAPAGLTPSDIEYQAVLGRGWLSPWAEGGQFCGSRGMSLPILGLRVRLRGAAAEGASLLVSATFMDGTRVGPVADGGAVEAESLAPLEAFQITLQRSRKAGAAPRAIGAAAPPAAAPKTARKAPAPAALPRCAGPCRTGRGRPARRAAAPPAAPLAAHRPPDRPRLPRARQARSAGRAARSAGQARSQARPGHDRRR